MDVSYQGEWGYGPLIVSLANTGEVLYAVNRSVSRPSHEGAPEWIDRAIALVRGGGFQKVRLRGDTDFSLTCHLDRWTGEGVEFNFGIDANPTFVAWAEQLLEEAWSELVRSSGRKAGKKGRKRQLEERKIHAQHASCYQRDAAIPRLDRYREGGADRKSRSKAFSQR